MKNGIGNIIEKMLVYFDGDVKRVNHALKVYAFAKSIGELEGLEAQKQGILEAAAVLHDIGIKESERKYRSAAGKYQEIEGPPVAHEILQVCGFDSDFSDRVCYLVGNHHSYGKIDDADFQILVESDFLVNIFEDGMEIAQVRAVREKYFKTGSGIRFLDSLYGG